MPEYSTKEWKTDSSDTNIYKTNYYSGADADISTEKFTDDIDLTEYPNVDIHFKFLGNNATDDLYLKLYKRNDSVWTGNELQWKSTLTIENDGTETEYHYTIPMNYGAGHYRFGMVRSGSTTTFDIQVDYRISRSWNLMRTD